MPATDLPAYLSFQLNYWFSSPFWPGPAERLCPVRIQFPAPHQSLGYASSARATSAAAHLPECYLLELPGEGISHRRLHFSRAAEMVPGMGWAL